MTTTSTQAWAILKRHARDEIATLRLKDLCQDNDRVSSLVAVHNSTALTGPDGQPIDHNPMLLVDLSRQRMTLETLNHLLKLSVTRGVKKYITRLAWGQNHPETPLQISNPQITQHAARRRSDRNNNPTAIHIHGKHKEEQQQHTHNNKNNNPPPDYGNSFPEVMPSMHLALRAPKDQGLHMLTRDGVNALTAIHREWDRLERLSDSIRRGAWRSATGQMIRDVVVVGRGVAIQALKFADQALCHDEKARMARKFGLDNNTLSSSSGLTDWSGATSRLFKRGLTSGSSSQAVRPRRLHFLSSVDPLAVASLVGELDAGSTMVVSFALEGNEETGLATQATKNWLLQQLAGTSGTGQPLSSTTSSKKVDSILSKHMLLVTGNDQIATSINKPESVFLIPEHSRCEAFISFSAATLLPMSIVYGWSICEQFLAGGHDMDCHFVESNPRHNLPVLLALTDVWNDAFLGASTRVETPFTQSANGFPAFVAALEAQACSGNNMAGIEANHLACSSLVLDGGGDSVYDRALYQSPKIQYTEMIMVMNTQLKANAARSLGGEGMDEIFHHADALICSLFGHADELAFGGNHINWNAQNQEGSPKFDFRQVEHSPRNDAFFQQEHNLASREGNRPSTLLICGTLDAFACGQLIALSEHRAAVKARIWDIDPFTPEAGYAMRTSRAEQIHEGLDKIYLIQELGPGNENEDENEEIGTLNLSSKTILGHYARVRS